MRNIRITKEFSFEMAHALTNHKGPCKNIHGHSYKLAVTVIGVPMQNQHAPDSGMVIDYSELGKLIKRVIVEPFDHCLVLHKTNADKIKPGKKSLFGKVKLVEFQPTCENLLIYFGVKIKEKLPARVKLHHLKLRETDTSFAEWYHEDDI